MAMEGHPDSPVSRWLAPVRVQLALAWRRLLALICAYRFVGTWLTVNRRLPVVLVVALVVALWLLPPVVDYLANRLFPEVVENFLGIFNKVSKDPRRAAFVRWSWVVYWFAITFIAIRELLRALEPAMEQSARNAEKLLTEAERLLATHPDKARRCHRQALSYIYSPARRIELAQLPAAVSDTDKTLVVTPAVASTSASMDPRQRYKRVKELGRGAMGTVFLAYDQTLERHVALKTLSATMNDPEAVRQRFSKEARMVAKLNHPGIVQIYDFFESEGQGYIAMEYVKGRPLSVDIIKQTLDRQQKLAIAGEIAGAMAYAHGNGVIHRDLKPANILLTENGRVKITDFGLAKLTGTQETQIGTVMGSPLYMSPEQAEGKAVDGRSDIYAFGVLLYELFTGELLFKGETATQVIAQHLTRPVTFDSKAAASLSQEEKQLLSLLLAKNPDGRPRSFDELLVSLPLSADDH